MAAPNWITLKQARAIDAVAKTRSFEHAARVLNTSQSVVSRTIAGAEKKVGGPLFERGWSGTEPTAWGEAVLRRCSAALALIDRAEDDIATLHGTRPKLKTFLRWHHLEAVSAVVRFGGASAASAHLGVTQPAISRSVAALSEYAGQPLFERQRNGLAATPQAQRLATLRDELLQELAMVESYRLRPKTGLVGRLAVGMLPFSGQDLVAKAFGTLTSRHPDLRLMAVPGSYNMLAEALKRGEIDCMVGILRERPPVPDLVETFLYHERFTLVARWDHPCHGKALTIPALKDEKWIVGPHGTPVRAYFERIFQNVGTTPPAQTCEILSFVNAEQVIANSVAVGLLSYSAQNLASLLADLRKVDVELPDSDIAIGLTTQKSRKPSEILAVFEELLLSYVDRPEPHGPAAEALS
ncbi:LysR family transcriptional regulator [Amorphus sp. 3PC139-8]|uniref:LysR family transcriptional regulator n=1 Tax=Amorphus sp. 3PC139-8 TaxID=2735676 RepID=UPI00345DAF97